MLLHQLVDTSYMTGRNGGQSCNCYHLCPRVAMGNSLWLFLELNCETSGLVGLNKPVE